MKNINTLLEDWKEVLDSDKTTQLRNDQQREDMAVMLENQRTQGKLLNEAGEPTNVAGGSDYWQPIMISLVRRYAPKLIAYDIMGVQPMKGPVDQIFALRSRYKDNANLKLATEALYNEANSAWSGGGTHVGTDPFDPAFAVGKPVTTAVGEGDGFNEMGMTIEKSTVEAGTRRLKATYSIEMAQDYRAIHGLDAGSELNAILSTEIIAEINRELFRTVYGTAKLGAADAATPGTIDLLADTDGRWSAERFKGLAFWVEREANTIARETRAGKGNVILCSSDVAAAMALSGLLEYAPQFQSGTDITNDIAGSTYAGMYRSMYKVFIDPYVTSNFLWIGYKGATPLDAGMFYCPYVGLQPLTATDPETMQPIIGFKTRYGVVSNPFVGNMNARSNQYYRIMKVDNVL